MNRLLSIIAVILAALLCAVPAPASSCRAVVVKKQVVVVAQAAIVAPVVATYIPVPLYGAAYTPAPQAASDADLAGAVKGLAEEVRRLTERINAGKGGTGPNPGDKPDDPFNPAKPVKADPVLLTFQAKCAACHEAQRAKASGGGFVLLEGSKGRELSGEDLGKIISAVASGSMPKGNKMTDAERVAFIAALVKK